MKKKEKTRKAKKTKALNRRPPPLTWEGRTIHWHDIEKISGKLVEMSEAFEELNAKRSHHEEDVLSAHLPILFLTVYLRNIFKYLPPVFDRYRSMLEQQNQYWNIHCSEFLIWLERQGVATTPPAHGQIILFWDGCDSPILFDSKLEEAFITDLLKLRASPRDILSALLFTFGATRPWVKYALSSQKPEDAIVQDLLQDADGQQKFCLVLDKLLNMLKLKPRSSPCFGLSEQPGRKFDS